MAGVVFQIGNAANVLLMQADFFERAEQSFVMLSALSQHFLCDLYHSIFFVDWLL